MTARGRPSDPSATPAASVRRTSRARRRETVPVLPKKVRVSHLAFGCLDEAGRLPFSISCSSGTYVRAIASELGEKLGSGAHLEALRRTRIGKFDVADAVALKIFEQMSLEERLRPPHSIPLSQIAFPFERLRLASLEAWKVRKGQPIPFRGLCAREGDWVTLLGPSEEIVALGQVTPMGTGKVSLVKPKIVLAD